MVLLVLGNDAKNGIASSRPHCHHPYSRIFSTQHHHQHDCLYDDQGPHGGQRTAISSLVQLPSQPTNVSNHCHCPRTQLLPRQQLLLLQNASCHLLPKILVATTTFHSYPHCYHDSFHHHHDILSIIIFLLVHCSSAASFVVATATCSSYECTSTTTATAIILLTTTTAIATTITLMRSTGVLIAKRTTTIPHSC